MKRSTYFKNESIFPDIYEFATPCGKFWAEVDSQKVMMRKKMGHIIKIFIELFDENGDRNGWVFDKKVFVHDEITCEKIYEEWIVE